MKEVCEQTFNNLDYEDKKFEIIEEFNYLKTKLSEIYFEEDSALELLNESENLSDDEYLNLVYKNLIELKIITTNVIKKSYGIEE